MKHPFKDPEEAPNLQMLPKQANIILELHDNFLARQLGLLLAPSQALFAKVLNSLPSWQEQMLKNSEKQAATK